MFAGFKEAIWGTAERWFPDRQIYHRSDGQVRYFAITTGMQISALVGAAILAGWLCFTSVSVAFHGQALASMNDEMERRIQEANSVVRQVQASEAAATALLESTQEEFDRSVVEFQSRHETLRQLIQFAEHLSGEALSPSPMIDNERVLMAATPADPTPREARDVVFIPTAASDSAEDRIIALVGEQEAVLAQAEDAAEARLETLRSVMRLTGFGIDEIMAQETTGEEQGGPLVPIIESFGPNLDMTDEFTSRISRIAARMLEAEQLEDMVRRTPLGEPVSVPYRRTSPFGPRRDPFTGRPQAHRGMDFAAYRRAPIVSTAPGEVVYAGWRSGYGRFVEIDHGYGFRTRYGHLHEISVRRGDTVERGQLIGGMGNTGRSTATHLHYEIWFDGSPIDPERLLRAGRYVQQE
ncbi:peptidoglycan DD-metalloendopeptidase family protein [Maricaulis sp. D1M11]|uniref:peptidoglycan DD-metalloendopeptidase family protein n=1 Tax=Maricaulis sp. D1M11 TaxID=3076117 RepID=UPI0039B611FE